MPTAFLVPKNNAFSNLNGAINDSVLSLTVVDGTKFPSTFPFNISIESEILQCTARATHVLTVVRAQEGTTAASHADATLVELLITAKAVSDLNTSVNALEAIDFLIGTFTGVLPNGIVAGVAPGGELGGTWASPTVDATHAGSAHHAESHTLASHSAKAHSDLTGIGVNDHHAQAHSISGADHTGSLAHTALSGLITTDAGHTQFPLLAGRAGGQTLAGSTLTAESLTLKGNAVDLTGTVVLGSTAKFVLTESTGQLSLPTTGSGAGILVGAASAWYYTGGIGTLIGGASASDDLYLEATSHATKTNSIVRLKVDTNATVTVSASRLILGSDIATIEFGTVTDFVAPTTGHIMIRGSSTAAAGGPDLEFATALLKVNVDTAIANRVAVFVGSTPAINANNMIQMDYTTVDPTAQQSATVIISRSSGTASVSKKVIGLICQTNWGGAQPNTLGVSGGNFLAAQVGSGLIAQLDGGTFRAWAAGFSGGVTLANAGVFEFVAEAGSSGTWATVNLIKGQVIGTLTTITNLNGLVFAANFGTRATTNTIAIDIPTITGGATLNIGIRNAASLLQSGNIGFFTVTTPIAQQTSGANLTNNVTSGGTTDTIANYTDLIVYANDAAAIRNDIYQLSRKLKQVNDALRAYGLLT